MKEIEELLKQESDAILNIPATEDFYKATELIYDYVQEKSGKLICSGMGKAGQIALNMATTFSSTGTPA
ncbi:MAG: iron dicitrate transport regulator FecR, partial [Bacteroidales bacterium]|nr:iron dicitrate transport regulator FecR [Bacteroidales bacterium]